MDCPICFQLFDESTVDPCPCCRKRICTQCVYQIRTSHGTPSACPFCRIRWITPRHEWRRRIQGAQRVLNWAETLTDDVSPVVALTQVALMGIWLWNNT